MAEPRNCRTCKYYQGVEISKVDFDNLDPNKIRCINCAFDGIFHCWEPKVDELASLKARIAELERQLESLKGGQ